MDNIEENAISSNGNKKPSTAQSVASWGKTLLAAVVLALLIRNFLVVNAAVVSGSMETTIMTGDRVICNRLAYLGGEPQRFDVIAFDFREGDTEKIYVKRIIGLPGETLEIRDGKVYLNGSDTPLPDDFVDIELRGEPFGDFGPFEVPQGQYFVLGDNRNASYDSKSWDYPYITRKSILGKALFIYYPKVKAVAGL